jgi:hypothetical protein
MWKHLIQKVFQVSSSSMVLIFTWKVLTYMLVCSSSSCQISRAAHYHSHNRFVSTFSISRLSLLISFLFSRHLLFLSFILLNARPFLRSLCLLCFFLHCVSAGLRFPSSFLISFSPSSVLYTSCVFCQFVWFFPSSFLVFSFFLSDLSVCSCLFLFILSSLLSTL